MKIAMVLCGLTQNFEASFPILQEKILKKYNPDVYLHAWETSSNVIDNIKKIYNPSKFLFEPQQNFIDEIEPLNLSGHENETYSAQKTFSYTCSRKRGFELIDGAVEYDCVIVCRYDVYCWRGSYTATELDKMDFSDKLDMNFLYSRYWNQLNAGMAEQWFFGNYQKMKTVCELYDRLSGYLCPDSEYKKLLKEGWPISNIRLPFSNEILKPKSKRCLDLITIPEIPILNHHYLYKYHLYKSDLLEDCKFI